MAGYIQILFIVIVGLSWLTPLRSQYYNEWYPDEDSTIEDNDRIIRYLNNITERSYSGIYNTHKPATPRPTSSVSSKLQQPFNDFINFYINSVQMFLKLSLGYCFN